MKKNLSRIGDLFEIEKGSLQSSKNVAGKYDFITAAETWKTHESFTHNCEALIFAAAASGSLGRTHYINGKFIASDLCFILVPKDLKKYYVDLKFYHFVFNNLREQIVKATKTGTSKDSINITNFSNYEIPYINERSQKLWIEKLKKAEILQKELLEVNEYQQTHLQQLRQSILQEAVQGKLTKQDPKDEPADKLLQRIKAEKQKLIVAGKLKKEKELPPITEDEIPFELPKGWVWCRLEELCNHIVDCPHSTPKFQSDGQNCIDTTSMDQGVILWEKMRKVSKETFDERNRRLVPKGNDIIFSREGTVGVAVILPKNNSVCLGQRVMLFRASSFVLPKYFRFSIVSPMFVKQWEKNHIGAASKHINIRDIKQYLIPLSPFPEQQRIVAKVEQLMQMVNELEQQVQQSREQAGQLLQAVLKEAFTPKGNAYVNEQVTLAAEL